MDYYGAPPSKEKSTPLVDVRVHEVLTYKELRELWREVGLVVDITEISLIFYSHGPSNLRPAYYNFTVVMSSTWEPQN